MLNVVNRYWNQLNEDIRVLLQRFDAETADEAENKSEFDLICFINKDIEEIINCIFHPSPNR